MNKEEEANEACGTAQLDGQFIDYIDSNTSKSISNINEDEYVPIQRPQPAQEESGTETLTKEFASLGQLPEVKNEVINPIMNQPKSPCPHHYAMTKLFQDNNGAPPIDTQQKSTTIGSGNDGNINGSIGSGSLGYSGNNNGYNTPVHLSNSSTSNATTVNNSNNNNAGHNWQLFSVTLHRSNPGGFGIAISGGVDNPNLVTGDSSIFVSDVISSGPAYGLLHVNDQIISANGFSLEYADYATAIAIMKDAEQLNMIVKRRVPVPFVEFEQRTLKFTLSKLHKKDDFGIVLGCRYYIKEITNPKLAEKDPGLKEGDVVLRVNGQSLEQMSMEDAMRLLHRSREKLSLVVQRDVRRCTGGSRWPSQTTVYERLGSVSATPRQSPIPVHYTYSATLGGTKTDSASVSNQLGRKLSDFSPGPKRFSDSVVTGTTSSSRLEYPSPVPQHNQHFFQQNYLDNSQSLSAMNSSQNLSSNSVQQHLQQQQQAIHSPHLSNNHHQISSNNAINLYHHQQIRQSPQTFAHNYNSSAQQLQSHTQMTQSQQNLGQYLHAQQKSQTPNSLIMSSSSIGGSPRPPSLNNGTTGQSQHSQQTPSTTYNSQQNTNSSGSDNYNFYSANQNASFQYSGGNHLTNKQQHNNNQADSSNVMGMCGGELRVVNFRKGSGSLGIRVIGGNQVGIFVSAVQEDSPAAQNGIRVGDRLHHVNGFNMNGVTREQAVEYLMALGDEVNVEVEHSINEDFSHIKSGQMGDSFYIRTHFCYQKRSNRQELSFQAGDIFHVTDTLAGGSVGYWQVTKVYSVNESEIKSTEASGIIPNSKTAEILAKQSRVDSTTLSRSIFRKKLLQSHRTKSLTANTNADDDLRNSSSKQPIFDIQLPAYERVALKKPAFHRPVVLFGPLSDVARNLLLANYGAQFGVVVAANDPTVMFNNGNGESIMRMSSIDSVMASQKHCVLSISPGSVECLQLAQYAPIVILIDVDSRSRIRELRSKVGSTTVSARKLMEQASKIKKHHAHLLTATLDASKEEGWFEALLHLIFHLQDRRVWMPEFLPTQPIKDLVLFPNPTVDTPDGDTSLMTSLKPFGEPNNGIDYGIYDATGNGAAFIQSTPAHKLTLVDRRTTNEKYLLPDNSDGNLVTSSNFSSSHLSTSGIVNGGDGNWNSPFYNSTNFLQGIRPTTSGPCSNTSESKFHHKLGLGNNSNYYQEPIHNSNLNYQRPMSASANVTYNSSAHDAATRMSNSLQRSTPGASPRHFGSSMQQQQNAKTLPAQNINGRRGNQLLQLAPAYPIGTPNELASQQPTKSKLNFDALNESVSNTLC